MNEIRLVIDEMFYKEIPVSDTIFHRAYNELEDYNDKRMKFGLINRGNVTIDDIVRREL